MPADSGSLGVRCSITMLYNIKTLVLPNGSLLNQKRCKGSMILRITKQKFRRGDEDGW